MRRTIREEAATSGGLGAVCVELCQARWNVSAARLRRPGQGLDRLIFEDHDEAQAVLTLSLSLSLSLSLRLRLRLRLRLSLSLPLTLAPSPNPSA